MKPVPADGKAPEEPLPAGGSHASGTFSRPGVTWMVLALCLLATGIGWRVSLRQVRDRGQASFDLFRDRLKRAIRTRMAAYEQVLNGAGGLYAASKSVERDEWRAYVNRLSIRQHYPGIRALGFIA